jgi:hypothetical protein
VLHGQWTSINTAFLGRLRRALAETQQDQSRQTRRLARDDSRAGSRSTAIDIRNSTGGSAIVTGAAVAGSYG